MSDISKSCEVCCAPVRGKNRFCSTTCSNRGVKRRQKKVKQCVFEGCINNVEYHTNKFCKDCKQIGRHHFKLTGGKLYSEITIAEFCKRQGANKFDAIRAAARKIMKDVIDSGAGCENCKWPHHVEVCHIKPIAMFSEDTLISEVNHLDNLKLLCPNCHWLFDHPCSYH